MRMKCHNFSACINRNILECKDEYGAIGISNAKVLIETYWNVKEDSHHGTIHSK